MENDKEKLIKQHKDNYINAIIDNITNNTNALVDEDFKSLVRKPPLDSMDLIKSKFLSLAKKNKIVLNTKEIDNNLDLYRNYFDGCFKEIKKIRIDGLTKVVNDMNHNDLELIKLKRGDFNIINKNIRKLIKVCLKDAYMNTIIKNINKMFDSDLDTLVKSNIQEDILKYLKGTYQRQLLENFDIKMLVKDTTLINTTKESTERYLFTLENSRVLNDL